MGFLEEGDLSFEWSACGGIVSRGAHPPMPMVHIAYCPYFPKNYKFPLYFREIYECIPISAKFRESTFFA